VDHRKGCAALVVVIKTACATSQPCYSKIMTYKSYIPQLPLPRAAFPALYPMSALCTCPFYQSLSFVRLCDQISFELNVASQPSVTPMSVSCQFLPYFETPEEVESVHFFAGNGDTSQFVWYSKVENENSADLREQAWILDVLSETSYSCAGVDVEAGLFQEIRADA
jgi:hypothetical protein